MTISCAEPVVDGDVSLQVELPMAELDHREASAAHYLDLVYTRCALSQYGRHQLQQLRRGSRGQVDVGQDGVFRLAVFRLVLGRLRDRGENERALF